MMALNLAQLKVSKNTKSHIWNRHKLHKKQVMEQLTYGILDAIKQDKKKKNKGEIKNDGFKFK